MKSMDEPDFLAIARNLAFEGVFAREDGTVTAYRAPGLVFFFAPFVRLGAGLMELRLINAATAGLGLVVLFDLVRRHGGPLAGLLAVALVPAWPVMIYAATTIYPQTLQAVLLVLTVWCLDRATRSPGVLPALLAGLACGAAILTAPIVLLVFPILAGWLLWRSARRWSHTILFCLVSGLLVSSWTARNYVVFDAFIPVATSSGLNLLVGNSPETRPDTALEIRFPEYVYTEITGKDEVERNRILTRAAVREMTGDPARTIRLYFGKFLHWFDYSNKLVSDDVVEGGASAIKADLRDMILFGAYMIIVLPLLAHLILIRRYPFKPVEILFLALWIGAGLAYAIFFTRVRFRLPFDWFVIASNGIFLAAVIEGWATRRGLSVRGAAFRTREPQR